MVFILNYEAFEHYKQLMPERVQHLISRSLKLLDALMVYNCDSKNLFRKKESERERCVLNIS